MIYPNSALYKNDSATINLISKRLIDIGYEVSHMELDGALYARFTHVARRPWLTQAAHIAYPMTSATIAYISKHKDVAYQLANSFEVSAPVTMVVENDAKYDDGKLSQFLKIHKTLIVKPANASLSNGLTLNISTISELNRALSRAFEYDGRALIQQQVHGDEIRFVVINGEVTAAIKRETPRLVGNGKNTMSELLEVENQRRAKIKGSIVKYPSLDRALIEAAGSTVLSDGEICELSRATMIKNGASMYSVLGSIHESYITKVQEIVRCVGAKFIVVDMMLEDSSQPASSNNYNFIEFNTAPVLKLFYSCRDGKNYDILGDLIPMIDRALSY